MSSREDIIEIPIEIQTSDLEELNKLIQELQEAKGTVESARATRKIKSTGTGAPIQTQDPEILSIFRSDSDRDTVPMKTRDVKSRQAIQKVDSFHEMSSRLNNLESASSEMSGILLNTMGSLGINVPYLSSSLKGISIGKNMIKKSINKAPIPTTNKSTLGGLTKIGKALPLIGGAIFAIEGIVEIVTSIIDSMYSAGGVMDRRFKRIIKDELASEAERRQKTSIAQGFRTVITTSSGASRGSSGVRNTLGNVRSNKTLYDDSMQFSVRGG